MMEHRSPPHTPLSDGVQAVNLSLGTALNSWAFCALKSNFTLNQILILE